MFFFIHTTLFIFASVMADTFDNLIAFDHRPGKVGNWGKQEAA
jgi:hypothetical protein